MLTINDLDITCRRDLRTIVSHLSLNLGPGERCAVVGEEGNGKSTLLKLLYDPGLVEPYAEYTGSFSFGGDRPSYLPQEADGSELALPAEDPSPLVLDDALTDFDDGRMALALDCLKDLSQERQILLFTCHGREKACLEG